MTSPLNWQEFLEQASLPLDTTCLQAGNPLHALVKVTGSDAESFLHAQLSNSVTGLKENEVRFAAWCNARGRVWALLRYWKDGDAFILRLPADQVEDTLRRMRMFVLRSDVQFEPLDLQATQFIGPQADEESASGVYNITLPAAWPLHETWTTEPLDSGQPELPRQLLALPRILAGVPEVFVDQREKWIPQMLNLDKLDAIDFKKGCYPGQEIVAKLHYKGGLKQRLFTAQVSGSIPEQAISISGGKKTAGTVLEACQLSTDTWLTAVIRLESHHESLSIDGLQLALEPLSR